MVTTERGARRATYFWNWDLPACAGDGSHVEELQDLTLLTVVMTFRFQSNLPPAHTCARVANQQHVHLAAHVHAALVAARYPAQQHEQRGQFD